MINRENIDRDLMNMCMRIDLHQCDFSNCRRHFDGNCNSKEAFRNCTYQNLLNSRHQIEKLIEEYNNKPEYYDTDGYVNHGAVEALETLLLRLYGG